MLPHRHRLPKSSLRTKALKQDDSIMATNNSSIVSKRSVERLYYPDEPHFFRYFVKKPQRRAPLINRGYWLRMKAVDHVVHRFLQQPTAKTKVVINLGCGYDPLPWQCLSRYPENCGNLLFIDIDYKDLMKKKRDVVQNSPELHQMLRDVSSHNETDILFRSHEYVQIGCDLRDLSALSAALAEVVDLQQCTVLFTAEVSVTYMNFEAANALIRWTAKFQQAQFCLLEQLLPEGPDHPFAKTMMAHFEKLQTPLRSVQMYPNTVDQEQRFKESGWSKASARNLWQLWGSPDFLSSAERSALDKVEPFDEWEEFAVFACHYFLLVATNDSLLPVNTSPSVVMPSFTEQTIGGCQPSSTTVVNYVESPNPKGCRRFGASIPLRGSNRRRDLVGSFGGMGLNSRMNSYDVYGPDVNSQMFWAQRSQSGPSSRMCHTISNLGAAGALLVGGRTSPDNALADCWLYHKWSDSWERVDDLPSPRYRHSAVVIGGDTVLITGGKEDSMTINTEFLTWNRRTGFVSCSSNAQEMKVTHTFGAILAVLKDDSLSGEATSGILTGGITQDGIVHEKMWSWTLSCGKIDKPSLFFQPCNVDGIDCTLSARFGAAVVNHDAQVLIAGGITVNRLLSIDQEFISVGKTEPKKAALRIKTAAIRKENASPRQLLIGVSIASSNHDIILMGGGIVCFSFGTFWNKGCYTYNLQNLKYMQGTVSAENWQPNVLMTRMVEPWRYMQTAEAPSAIYQPRRAPEGFHSTILESPNRTTISRTRINGANDFTFILSRAQPVILEGLELGSCQNAWTNEYLVDRIGCERKIVVHKATSEQMDFATKNFEYVTTTFGDFMQAVEAGERLYLRSLAVDQPSEIPADLSRDFPTIAGDFLLPSDLDNVVHNIHSSPLRISGPVNMWLHYDVMSNILCQIRGSKRLLLFPPSDVGQFDFAPGASSSSIDVFQTLGSSRLATTHPYEAILNPGDVLFLPSLWLHAATPTDGMSVAVNVFFRSLQSGYAAGKDVYGNRDLQAYEKGRQDIAKIARSFDNLPVDVRRFYLQRLANELSQSSDSG